VKYEPWLLKAERFILSAEILLSDEDFDSAASRLYYGMFFVAQALLERLGLSFSSHRSVISAYGQHFAKSETLDPRFHRALIDAFNQRQLGDYSVFSGLNLSDVEIMLANASEFLTAARNWLETNK
jgi:uncharacterized protein (UPF0332 family)